VALAEAATERRGYNRDIIYEMARRSLLAKLSGRNFGVFLCGGRLRAMARQQATRKKSDPPTRKHNFAGEILVIDQAPLRRTIAADCSAAMARLERARLGWHKFERQDKPAFVRWRAREFGALLSKARDVEDEIRDAQTVVHEVEMEMRRSFQDPHSAYQRVMFRRGKPAAAAEEPGKSEGGKPGVARRLSDFEKEALFQEWVHKFLGTNPDKMDDEAYSTSFEIFKSHMFRAPSEEKKRQKTSGATGKREHEHEQEQEKEGTVDGRVKELYRILVRRLHPDLRADGTADVCALWHEVQEAYAASDVARMEILLALSDIQANQLGDGTSLSQMHTVLAELNRSLRALEKSLKEAEREDAWNFVRIGPTDDLRLRVERELKSDLATRMMRLDLFRRTIAGWAQEAGPKRRVMQTRNGAYARTGTRH
jgi:hypothetical protein